MTITLSDKQINAFKSNIRLCALTYKLGQAIQEQSEAIYGDDKYADLTVVVAACCVADQFRNVIGKKAPSKVMPFSDVTDYVNNFSDDDFLEFKDDKTLEQLSNNLTLILFNNYRSHLYGDNFKNDLRLMIYACKVADHYRKVTKPKIKKAEQINN